MAFRIETNYNQVYMGLANKAISEIPGATLEVRGIDVATNPTERVEGHNTAVMTFPREEQYFDFFTRLMAELANSDES